MVKLFSWRKDANKEKRWGKRWTYTFYFKQADRDAAKAAKALLEQHAEEDTRENEQLLAAPKAEEETQS